MKQIHIYSVDIVTLIGTCNALANDPSIELHIHLVSRGPRDINDAYAAYDLLQKIENRVCIYGYGVLSTLDLLVMTAVPTSQRFLAPLTRFYISAYTMYSAGTVDEAAAAQESFSRILKGFYEKIRLALDVTEGELEEWLTKDKVLDRHDMLALDFIDDAAVPEIVTAGKNETPRDLFITGEITVATAVQYARNLHRLLTESSDPIITYVNSPGGSVDAMLAMIDLRDSSKAPMFVVVCGQAASAAAAFSATFKKGTRNIMKNAEVMFHMPRGIWSIGDSSGPAETGNAFGRELKEYQEKLIADFSGLTPEQVVSELRIEKYLSAEEAVAFGAYDRII